VSFHHSCGGTWGKQKGSLLFFVAVASKLPETTLPLFPPPAPRTNTGCGSLRWCLTRYHLCGVWYVAAFVQPRAKNVPGPQAPGWGKWTYLCTNDFIRVSFQEAPWFSSLSHPGFVATEARGASLLLCCVAWCAIAADLVFSSLSLLSSFAAADSSFVFSRVLCFNEEVKFGFRLVFFGGVGSFGVLLLGWTSYLMPSCGGAIVFVGVSRSSIQRWRKRRGLKERQIDCGQSFCDLKSSANRK